MSFLGGKLSSYTPVRSNVATTTAVHMYMYAERRRLPSLSLVLLLVGAGAALLPTVVAAAARAGAAQAGSHGARWFRLLCWFLLLPLPPATREDSPR